MHPLDDCRLKIARAKEQFDSLRLEIIEFDKANPYVLHIQVDPQSGDELLKCEQPPAFPRRWGVLVGELAHNLRSALDYLVGVLIREGGGEPDGNAAFPISKSKDRYFRKNKRGVTYRDRVLRGLSPEMKERIDALQPFQRGELAYADMLLGLADLSNRDKHRELRPAYAWITTPTRAVAFPTDDELSNLEILMPGNGGVSVKADFQRGTGRPMAVVVYPDVKVQRPPGVEVVFGSDPSKLLGLDDVVGLILYVETIVESFAGNVQGTPTHNAPASGDLA
jgi:hypothetical protein